MQFSAAKTVDDVIEKYIRARGGRNKLDAVKSIYMEGMKETISGNVQVKITKEQEKLSRTEIDHNVVVITAEAAWTYFPQISPIPNRVPVENLQDIQTEMDIAGPLVDYAAKGHRAELLGKEQVEGNTCYKIKLTTQAGNVIFFWIDLSSYLLVQSSAISIDQEYAKSLISYSNYKEVEGIQFPHTFETNSNGKWINEYGREIVFHTIQINPVIGHTMYQPNI